MADLVLVGGVVQQEQGLAAVHAVAEHRRASVHPGGDLIAGHLQRPQKNVQHVRGFGRRTVGVEPAQVHIQLGVGEPACPRQLVSGVHGELGLSDPGHALDRGDRHAVAAGSLRPDQIRQVRQGLGASYERRQIGGQLPQHSRRPGGLGRDVHPHIRLTPPREVCLIDNP